MPTDFYAVIMAGGGGTRLWPISRQERPKQSLRLFGDKTPFQWAVDRLLPMMPIERILVATVGWQVGQLREQAPMLGEGNFLEEPAPRGTASVAGLAALAVRRKDPEAVMALLTADHFIGNPEQFREILLASHEVAQSGDMVTLGISPTFPAERYGYIHMGEAIGNFGGFEAWRVAAFVEKPSPEKAQRYLDSGEYLWNSGMFIWKAERLLEEIERLMPDLHDALSKIDNMLDDPSQSDKLTRIYKGLQSETIDYGIMERAERVAVVPAPDLGWFDIGGWDGLFTLVGPNEENNVVLAPKTLIKDTTGTLVFQEEKATRLIATLGVEDLIIVDAGDVLLVCPREKAERVRSLVESLRQAGMEQYL
ncbi:MAG: sugar phosphate nucleotidyltransferase [Anaerolineales bacterium]|jgi:mannose-1-phosphate guanylyltransferase